MAIKRIVVIADIRKSEVQRCLPEIRSWLEKHGEISGWYDKAEELSSLCPDQTDFIMVFGGDGLLIATARSIAKTNIPIIGVNFGRLGFLTEFNLSEFFEQIPSILSGNNSIVSRMMLNCEVERDREVIYSSLAVNDAVIKITDIARMLYTTLFIDNEEITTYGGDGIIIATPVGSTAYSLSAGGPIISPNFSAFVITPICPHLLTLRPLVVGMHHFIKIRILATSKESVVLSLDGQINLSLQNNDQVKISRSQESFHLIQNNNRSFYRVLQEKLTWGEANFNMKNALFP